MPLIIEGEGFRVFAEPTIFACDSESQIEQIETPVDNAFAFVADSLGVSDFEIWRFNASSAAAASATVIIPDNPLFAALGRWIKMLTGGGSGSGVTILGSGPPEGVQAAASGAWYRDTDPLPSGQATYLKESSPTPTTGWVLQYQS